MGLLDLVEGAYEASRRLWDQALLALESRFEGEEREEEIESVIDEKEIAFENAVELWREVAQAAETAMFRAGSGDYVAARLELAAISEPAWDLFWEACELAEELDNYLAVLEPQAPRALVAGCRDDLDTLPILADWCEENGLPMAGREARRLHDLVRWLR
jgi:hypothetical protein